MYRSRAWLRTRPYARGIRGVLGLRLAVTLRAVVVSGADFFAYRWVCNPHVGSVFVGSALRARLTSFVGVHHEAFIAVELLATPAVASVVFDPEYEASEIAVLVTKNR